MHGTAKDARAGSGSLSVIAFVAVESWRIGDITEAKLILHRGKCASRAVGQVRA
jgi:hypothetical protein